MGGVPTQGGSVLISGELGTTQPARTFSPFALNAISNAETSGGSLWISFLAQRQGEALTGVANPYPRGVNVSLFDAATLNDEKTGVGNSSGASDNTWSIVPDGSGGAREGAYDPAGGVAGGGPDNVGATTFPFEELQWAVVRIDYAGAGGNQDMYLWLSPDPTSVPDTMDADAAVLGDDTNFRTLLGIGGLRPFVGALDTNADPDRPFGVLAWDEFRVGTSFADMTSTTVIPEPTSLVLVALGCCLAGLARRRNG
jgi:hypothetical protein